MAYEYDANGQHFYDNFQTRKLFTPKFFIVISNNKMIGSDTDMIVKYDANDQPIHIVPTTSRPSATIVDGVKYYVYTGNVLPSGSDLYSMTNYANSGITPRKETMVGIDKCNALREIISRQPSLFDNTTINTAKDIIVRFYYRYSNDFWNVPGYIYYQSTEPINNKGEYSVKICIALTEAQRAQMKREYYIVDSYGSRMYIQIDNTRRELYVDNGSIAVKNDNAVSKFGKIWVKSENTWRSVYSSPGGTQYYQ